MFPVFMVYCSSFFPVDRNARRAPAPPRCLLSHFRTGGLPDILVYISENVFILPSFGKHMLSGYRILGWKFSFFQYFKDILWSPLFEVRNQPFIHIIVPHIKHNIILQLLSSNYFFIFWFSVVWLWNCCLFSLHYPTCPWIMYKYCFKLFAN